jgi:hypothetical protein
MIMLFVFIGVQGAIQILIMCWVFFLVWQTFLFKYGLIGILCKEFKTLFIILPIGLLLFGIEKGLRMMLLLDSGIDTITIWEQPHYTIIYWIRYFFLVFYYLFLIEKALSLGDPIYYKPQRWLI